MTCYLIGIWSAPVVYSCSNLGASISLRQRTWTKGSDYSAIRFDQIVGIGEIFTDYRSYAFPNSGGW